MNIYLRLFTHITLSKFQVCREDSRALWRTWKSNGVCRRRRRKSEKRRGSCLGEGGARYDVTSNIYLKHIWTHPRSSSFGVGGLQGPVLISCDHKRILPGCSVRGMPLFFKINKKVDGMHRWPICSYGILFCFVWYRESKEIGQLWLLLCQGLQMGYKREGEEEEYMCVGPRACACVWIFKMLALLDSSCKSVFPDSLKFIETHTQKDQWGTSRVVLLRPSFDAKGVKEELDMVCPTCEWIISMYNAHKRKWRRRKVWELQN